MTRDLETLRDWLQKAGTDARMEIHNVPGRKTKMKDSEEARRSGPA